ncbi:MAG: alpha-ketoglutarate-dependent taurine dioxygenase [Cocleimonas sp.]|jgi:alpha-ketoglutarate-dependent taurine dioxygenase
MLRRSLPAMSSLHLIEHSLNLRIPQYCCFDHTQSEELDCQDYLFALQKKGIVIINLDSPDNSADIMNKIVAEIGIVHEHDSQGRTIWDVKVGGETGSESLAISHNDSEFLLHTDGAFEEKTPGFFGLYVVRADRCGGGESVIVNAEKLIENLSETTFNLLSTTKFRLRVPLEFHKESDYICETLIDQNLGLRYRHDIIDRAYCSKEELTALAELELQLALPHNMLKLNLKDQQIMLLDNRRYLHARTKIKDRERHLKRIRFNIPNALYV